MSAVEAYIVHPEAGATMTTGMKVPPVCKERRENWRLPRPDDLSFIVRRNRQSTEDYDYWAVQSTNVYSANCAAGQRMAMEYLDQSLRQALQLDRIVRDMPKELGGAETGFLHTIEASALVGYSALSRMDALDALYVLMSPDDRAST